MTSPHARAYATVTGPTASFMSPDGHTEALHATGGEDIRHAVVRRATDEARRTGTPVELHTSGDRGEHHLLIGADGDLVPLPPAAVVMEENPVVVEPALRSRRGEEVREEAQEPAMTGAAPEPPKRTSFIEPTHTDPPIRSGWRGWVSRAGVTVPPSRTELQLAEWEARVSRHWAGCRTLAIANGKGGVGKTMTTAMLAAVYARYGGGNVLAWDNNDTRGTLGWRTEQGLYDTTVRDLLPAAGELLAADASVSDITRYVHHQSADRYDVLRSNPELLATDQRIATADFDLLMQVAARYYRLVIFDSGNDESADRWLRVVDSSAVLVVPTLASPESAESAALLLEALSNRDERSADLARGAVVVVTQSEPSARKDVQRVAAGFEGIVRAVETIPFDSALKSGPLRFDALRPATRDAWLRTAAAAATGL